MEPWIRLTRSGRTYTVGGSRSSGRARLSPPPGDLGPPGLRAPSPAGDSPERFEAFREAAPGSGQDDWSGGRKGGTSPNEVLAQRARLKAEVQSAKRKKKKKKKKRGKNSSRSRSGRPDSSEISQREFGAVFRSPRLQHHGTTVDGINKSHSAKGLKS